MHGILTTVGTFKLYSILLDLFSLQIKRSIMNINNKYIIVNFEIYLND